MRRRLRIPDRANDAETALLRYLMYGLLPAWFIPVPARLEPAPAQQD
ncbi:hypothetical protein [Mycobacterium intracellulare]|nr:hypothetical protein [Mycobacterium intracellulare]